MHKLMSPRSLGKWCKNVESVSILYMGCMHIRLALQSSLAIACWQQPSGDLMYYCSKLQSQTELIKDLQLVDWYCHWPARLFINALYYHSRALALSLRVKVPRCQPLPCPPSFSGGVRSAEQWNRHHRRWGRQLQYTSCFRHAFPSPLPSPLHRLVIPTRTLMGSLATLRSVTPDAIADPVSC